MGKLKQFLSTVFTHNTGGWSFVDRIKVSLFIYYGIRSKCSDVWHDIYLISNKLKEPQNKTWETYRDLFNLSFENKLKNRIERFYSLYFYREPYRNPFSPRNIAHDLNKWKETHSKEV